MKTTIEAQEVIVRGSEEHKNYLRYQFGRIKDTVNGFETRIAVAGRAMLLVYVVYITVKAGVGNSLLASMPANVTMWLQVLDVLMLALQVLGLEGSVPGLRHLAEELEDKGKIAEARKVNRAMNTAQWLVAATAIDIVLERTHYIGSLDMTATAVAFTNVLFVLRVVVIGLYLVAMATLEHKGPKFISAHEAAKQKEEAEQKLIRINNTNILATVTQAIQDWSSTQPNLNTAFSESVKYLESVVTKKIESVESAQAEKISALSRMVEAAQFGSTTSGSIDSEMLTLQIESALSRSNGELMQRFESRVGEVSRHVSRVEATVATQVSEMQSRSAKALAEAEARHSEELRKTTAQVRSVVQEVKSVKEPAKLTQAKITDISEARAGLPLEEVKFLIEADQALLKLPGSRLAEKVGTSKATANRAKKEYLESHPESAQWLAQNSDSGELEAVNL